MTTLETMPVSASVRLRLTIRGAVQGVGFRPFVYRLASELGLSGWVNNSPQGVVIEVEGPHVELEQFRHRLEAEKPPRSFIQTCEATWLDAVGYDGFVIRESESGGDKTALVLPDIATCPDCLREIFDPTNRRYRYPFTNCTNCGPRFSIIEALPYDRANTSMRSFKMCPECQAEYDDARNRRFHAQPNACPMCGPRLEIWELQAGASPSQPQAIARDHVALQVAAAAIRRGQILAVKGIGGFHLMVDARSERAVRRLRDRKHREEKPLALMFPSLERVKEVCQVSPLEESLLASPEAPIVLLKSLDARPHPGPHFQERANQSAVTGEVERDHSVESGRAKSNESETTRATFESPETLGSRPLSPGERVWVRASVEQTQFEIAPSIAPGNPNLGVMLPSNPLHHLLMAEVGFPVVATSGNLSDEPICTDEQEALERLSGIADVFLVHNRPIVRHVDDSIVRVMLDREMVLRRARGYAPLPIQLGGTRSTASQTSQENGDKVELVPPATILAVGAHLKNSVALAVDDQVFISQHIGDLETEQASNAFHRAVSDLPLLYDTKPDIIATDLHPDYLSTKFANQVGKAELPLCQDAQQRVPATSGVQHHFAHVLSCIAENAVELPALGVAWDGTGYGSDGTIWGGEFFRVTEESVERVAHLRPFPLPGGDAAAQEPRRAALGLLHELFGCEDCTLSNLAHRVIANFSPAELTAITVMLIRRVNAPICSSAGRLFDAVASLAGVRQRMRFEGQAAMELEFAIKGVVTDEAYSLPLVAPYGSHVLDWSRMMEAIVSDLEDGVSVGEVSAKFHNALAEGIVNVAKEIDEPRVVLSGGCFQNRYLTERAVVRLREEGFQPYWHQRVPTNDGGIALGQIVAARRELARRTSAVCSKTNSGTVSLPPERCGWSGGHNRAPTGMGCGLAISQNSPHASP